jgi:hypothetical protein
MSGEVAQLMNLAREMFREAEYDPIPDLPITLDRALEVLLHAAEFVTMAENFLEGTGGSIE